MTREIYDVNTGSLISYPCDYREVTMSADFTDMAITTGRTQVEFAKERFRTAAQNQVAARGMAYSIIAPKAAEAFLIHAEGNEPDNANAATVLSQLESAADMGAMLIGADKAQAFKDMANSMLKDLNQYGVEGRENVTDDLSLTVKIADKYKLKYQIGDANGDGVVNVTDIVEIINFMNMKASAQFNKKAADVTGEGDVDENDINAISSLIMSEN